MYVLPHVIFVGTNIFFSLYAIIIIFIYLCLIYRSHVNKDTTYTNIHRKEAVETYTSYLATRVTLTWAFTIKKR